MDNRDSQPVYVVLDSFLTLRTMPRCQKSGG